MTLIRRLVLSSILSVLAACGADEDSETTNLPPSLISMPDMATVDMPYQFKLVTSDPENAPTSVTIKSSPAWLSLNNNLLQGTPQNENIGNNTLELIISDGKNQVIETINILVESSAKYVQINAKDFYALNVNNEPRELSNSLTGELKAEVQFVQSHSIHAGNNIIKNTADEKLSHYMPNLVPQRSALVLFMPFETTEKVTLIATNPDGSQFKENMVPPVELPPSDYSARDGRPDVVYSKNAWSIELPWKFIKQGMSISFESIDSKGKNHTGYIPANEFEFGQPTSMILQSIRLGLLTEPQVVEVYPHADVNHHMLLNPAIAASDYFQTVPIAKLTLGSYQTVRLDQVILSNGMIINRSGMTNGGVHNGDMRQDVAKVQVSTGINLANVGISSNHMKEHYRHVVKQTTIHHARGYYDYDKDDIDENGNPKQQPVHNHGLSGGNGIATLLASRGNELSHELGHGYGLGHYPGSSLTQDRKWEAHHGDSGWGYMAHRNRMRANLHWHWGVNPHKLNYIFNNLYTYNRDAMSDGETPTNYSVYTHHTGYSARIIQQHLSGFPEADITFPSGYKIWDSTTAEFINMQFNESTPKPIAVGVPVTTLLGGYDPKWGNGLIYQPFEGNYGNLFDLPAPSMNPSENECYLEINNQANIDNGLEPKRIALASTRLTSNVINQFHINLPADFLPTQAKLICRIDGIDEVYDDVNFTGVREPMPDPVTVGMEYGFKALLKEELPIIEQGLVTHANKEVIFLEPELLDLINSYKETQLEGLSADAKTVLNKLKEQNKTLTTLSRMLTKYQNQLTEMDTASMIKDWLNDRNLLDINGQLPSSSSLIMGSNRCISSQHDTNGLLTWLPSAECTSENINTQWFKDGRGAIHPLAKPEYCMIPKKGPSGHNQLALEMCDPKSNSQSWTQNNSSQIQNMQNKQCIDYAWNVGEQGSVILYSCHSGGNQMWQEISKNEHLLWSKLHGLKLSELSQIFH